MIGSSELEAESSRFGFGHNSFTLPDNTVALDLFF